MDPLVLGHRLQEALDRDPEARGVAEAKHRLQERVLDLASELVERVRVGRVAGLRALGLGQVQPSEQHFLQLLGAAEVDGLVVDGVPGVLLRLADLSVEVALERLELRDVDSDAGPFHPGEDVDER